MGQRHTPAATMPFPRLFRAISATAMCAALVAPATLMAPVVVQLAAELDAGGQPGRGTAVEPGLEQLDARGQIARLGQHRR